MSRDGADDRKTQGALQRLDGYHQRRAAPLRKVVRRCNADGTTAYDWQFKEPPELSVSKY
jgi:hypothetical protein